MIHSFIIISIIGVLLFCVTSVIIYELFAKVWQVLPHFPSLRRARVIIVIFPVFLGHILNIWLYGLTFLGLELYTDMGAISGPSHVTGLNFGSFFDCLYFSAVSYTTLGFGDYVGTGALRMLSATEALNGLVLMGWTISFTYLTMEDVWKTPGQSS